VLDAGDRLAIWLPNGPRWVELALAAKAAGAMCIAVNTRPGHDFDRVPRLLAGHRAQPA
jgi:acyl-CoA synthetase (AMP-forming)/AMP-acid ligase II